MIPRTKIQWKCKSMMLKLELPFPSRCTQFGSIFAKNRCRTSLSSSSSTQFRSISDISGSAGGSSSGSGNSSNSMKNGPVWERMAVAVKSTDKDTANSYLDTIRATHDPALHLKTVEDELKGTIGKALGRQGQKIMHAIQLMEKELQRYEELITAYNDSKKPLHKPMMNGYCYFTNREDVIQCAKNYNEYRKQAIQARWELTVHRQAAGFIVNNHNYVNEQYPIKPAIPMMELDLSQHDNPNRYRPNRKNRSSEPNTANVEQNTVQTEQNTVTTNTEQINTSSEQNAATSNSKKFTDQGDWWDRIGRWK